MPSGDVCSWIDRQAVYWKPESSGGREEIRGGTGGPTLFVKLGYGLS